MNYSGYELINDKATFWGIVKIRLLGFYRFGGVD